MKTTPCDEKAFIICLLCLLLARDNPSPVMTAIWLGAAAFWGIAAVTRFLSA